ncbi:MAG: S41 family peptidase, partial [Bacteroidota bacterium]
MRTIVFFLCLTVNGAVYSQDYGDFPKINKEKLLRDLELLQQGLDQYHTGMYWYTSKTDVEIAFKEARSKITKDLNVLAFHKIIAPLIALSNEDHTNIFLPEVVKEQIAKQAKFLPITIVFLGRELYLVKDGSGTSENLEGQKILSINGEFPQQIVSKIGSLFASDGYIEQVKFSDLEGFEFSKYYYYFYGNIPQYEIEFESKILTFQSLDISTIRKNLSSKYKRSTLENKESLEFKVIEDSIAYMAFHTFSNSSIKENKKSNSLKSFLESSFQTIHETNIKTLIIDVSKNGGGSEGNENLVYSYLGENYQKYLKVKANRQSVVLDNGIDEPIKLKTFGFFERAFGNKKMKDGSYERKENIGFGLKAYKKEPKYKFDGKLYVLISPVTYSGGSELCNMLHTNDLATFIGQETGGGYYGNTSGYSQELT